MSLGTLVSAFSYIANYLIPYTPAAFSSLSARAYFVAATIFIDLVIFWMLLIDFSHLVIFFKVAIFRTLDPLWLHGPGRDPMTPSRENMMALVRFLYFANQAGLSDRSLQRAWTWLFLLPQSGCVLSQNHSHTTHIGSSAVTG